MSIFFTARLKANDTSPTKVEHQKAFQPISATPLKLMRTDFYLLRNNLQVVAQQFEDCSATIPESLRNDSKGVDERIYFFKKKQAKRQ